MPHARPRLPFRACLQLICLQLACNTLPAHATDTLWFVPAGGDHASHTASGPVMRHTPARSSDGTPALLDATTLRSVELELGAYAPELAQHYLQHARAQQAAGLHEAALETLAKAAHSERMQQGLFTPTQFEIVQLEVRSHLARRDYLQAFARQEHLLWLHSRHYGTDAVDTVPTQAALGDLYFDAFRKLLLGHAALEPLRPLYGPQSHFLAPEDLTRHQLAYLWLGHAQQQYSAAIDTLLAQQAYAHPLLEALETQLLQALLLQAHERSIAIDPANFLRVQDANLRDTLRMDERDRQLPWYRAGIASHERIIAYRRATQGDAAAVADAMLALGDWHLLFGQTRRAADQYAQAGRWLQRTDCDPALAQRLLQPALPQQVAAFDGLYGNTTAVAKVEADVLNGGVLRADQSGSEGFSDGEFSDEEFSDEEFSDKGLSGYVDVSFSVGKSGRVQDFAVLGSSDNADKRVQRMLERQLRRAPFRPAIAADGSLQSVQHVNVRYHFAQ